MILTDDDIKEALGLQGHPTLSVRLDAKKIEAAVLSKLRGIVEVPEPDSEYMDAWFHSDALIQQYGDACALAASEQYRADAERYRWMRDSESIAWPSVDLANAAHRTAELGSPKIIDAAIDNAMKRGEA